MKVGNASVTIQAPCLDCPDRKVGCHSECPKYAEFKREVDESRAMVNKALMAEGKIARYVKENVARTKKNSQFDRKCRRS